MLLILFAAAAAASLLTAALAWAVHSWRLRANERESAEARASAEAKLAAFRGSERTLICW